jgi:hypothetical protein
VVAEDNTNKRSSGQQNPTPAGKAEEARPIASATLLLDATDAEVAEALRKDRLRRSRS